MVGRRRGSGTNVVAALVTLWATVTSVQSTSEQHDMSTLVKNQTLENYLGNATEVATNADFCQKPFHDSYRLLSVPMDTSRFRAAQQKTELFARFLHDSEAYSDKRIVNAILKNILESERSIYMARILLPSVVDKNKYLIQSRLNLADRRRRRSPESKGISDSDLQQEGPWWDSGDHLPEETGNVTCHWSNPYYWCNKETRWLVTYSCSFLRGKKEHHQHRNGLSDRPGHFAVDFDISHLDINQCDPPSLDVAGIASQIRIFVGTHKCNPHSSQCIFLPGGGWTKGSYFCQCKDGFYSTNGNPLFNGTEMEATFRSSHSLLYACRKCSPGCGTCTDASPCLSEYNWSFRIPLLIISMVCILFTLLLIGYIYHYRKLKVIKVASPIFLCITLLGAVIMYLEMVAIFPVLDLYSCVATKWTRHLGFCITYSALLLKTWRVSLTYRVKSAHKIKLTDKQLLQWLFPILLVMVIYLSTWTVSSPPEAEYIKDFNDLKFKQCSYNWWDHCLAIGEVFFLLWGIKVCYNVRNAESFFNEAKHISYAIYNIAIVNIIMVAIHLLIFPNAPPDIKYLFGFIRTQLSTTVTICLVFGPKFYRVIKGQGDVYDNRARARGVTASFSLNGIGLMHEETTDLYQENEELKEEIQKLASNIEFMKVVHMETINRHVKLKQGGYFSQCAMNATHSPIPKAIYMKFESSDSPTSRISPAAELISERV